MAITEVVQMEIADEIKDNEFIGIMDDLEKNFHMTLEGYIDSELYKGSDNVWRMTMHWESKKSYQAASKLMMTSELTEKFRNCLIPGKVKIAIYDQIKLWEK